MVPAGNSELGEASTLANQGQSQMPGGAQQGMGFLGVLPPASAITSVPLASSFGPHPFSRASSTSLGGANGPLTY